MANRLVLNAKLDTSNAVPLRDELVAAHGQDLVLDASAVEHIGGLCAEVLMSVRHLWRQNDTSITIENASSQLIDNLARMGLSLDDIATGDVA
ncbi:MAG: STAS domain-containing protein [Paracoccaceae bacterium]